MNDYEISANYFWFTYFTPRYARYGFYSISPCIIYYLVVSSNDDDTNTSTTAVLDGINDLLAGRIQHAYYADKGAVGLKINMTQVST